MKLDGFCSIFSFDFHVSVEVEKLINYFRANAKHVRAITWNTAISPAGSEKFASFPPSEFNSTFPTYIGIENGGEKGSSPALPNYLPINTTRSKSFLFRFL